NYNLRAEQATLPDFNLPGVTGKHAKPFLPEARDTRIADVDLLVLPPDELRDQARFDRVVTWTDGKGILVYAVGGTTPLGTAASVTSKPRGAVWLGDNLLVWNTDTVTLLKGDALAVAWSMPLRTLPTAEVVE